MPYMLLYYKAHLLQNIFNIVSSFLGKEMNVFPQYGGGGGGAARPNGRGGCFSPAPPMI